MKKARSHAVAKKKSRSMPASRVSRIKKVNRLKKNKKIKKNPAKKKPVVRELDLEMEREQWKKQRRDYWKRRFRRLVAN